MIFVTVGTTMPFDELLEEVDRLIASGALPEEVICQGGQSRYRMAHAEQFIGRPTIADLIDRASIVVTHGGATVIQLLLARKPFIAFPNPLGAGDHQTSFLSAVAGVSEISWSRDVRDLARLVEHRRSIGPARVPDDVPRARDIIADFISMPAFTNRQGQRGPSGQ